MLSIVYTVYSWIVVAWICIVYNYMFYFLSFFKEKQEGAYNLAKAIFTCFILVNTN